MAIPGAGSPFPAMDPNAELVSVLVGYLHEAQQGRRGGLNPRDDKWEQNAHLYWGRYDHSAKAEWQAKVSMPEISSFVDRFSAAMKEALVANPNGFYTVVDPTDKESDISSAIKRAMDAWLSICGTNMLGTPLAFPAVFEEQVKLGSMMSCASVVNWKTDVPYGRVAVETVDPRLVWLDATGRNLYRIRRTIVDKHQLLRDAGLRDRKGRSIYNIEAIKLLGSHLEYEDISRREQLTGDSQHATSTREQITLDEYIATVVTSDGRVLADNALMVVANGNFLIRGPEPNPFWHKKDWLSYTPLISAPLSVYGRSYMEDFGSIAETFNSLTNLILDAVQTSSLRAFAIVPSMLMDPAQALEPITPNKVYRLEDGADAAQFLQAVELGRLPPESVQVWTTMKNELREAADINEIGLGQFAPKSRTSATEISQTQESSSALIRSVANTVENRFLNPQLDLIWKTGLQHVKRDDPAIRAAMGDELFNALIGRRKELLSRPLTFQARGISTLIQKAKMLRALLMLFQILSQSDLLLQEFLKNADLGKLVQHMFELSDIDMTRFTLSDRERLIRGTVEQMNAGAQAVAQRAPAQPGQSVPEGTQSQMRQIASNMGVAQ